jgi:hypothetical protein
MNNDGLGCPNRSCFQVIVRVKAAECLDWVICCDRTVVQISNPDSPPHLRHPNPPTTIQEAAGFFPLTGILVAMERSTVSVYHFASNMQVSGTRVSRD